MYIKFSSTNDLDFDELQFSCNFLGSCFIGVEIMTPPEALFIHFVPSNLDELAIWQRSSFTHQTIDNVEALNSTFERHLCCNFLLSHADIFTLSFIALVYT